MSLLSRLSLLSPFGLISLLYVLFQLPFCLGLMEAVNGDGLNGDSNGDGDVDGDGGDGVRTEYLRNEYP